MKTIANIALWLVLISVSVKGETLFSFGSTFSYLKGSEAASLGENWKQSDYNSDQWETAPAPFWYGDGTVGLGTQMNDMRNAYTTFYLRSTFDINDIDQLSKLRFNYNYDDGFALYINGEAVLLNNAPASPSQVSVAPANHESGTVESRALDPEDCNLLDGENLIAVQVFNVSLTSSDVYFDLSIDAELIKPTLPDSLVVTFSDSSGFYTDPFTLNLDSDFPEYQQIKYTLDGSDPNSSSTALVANTPAQVLINPSSTVGRGLTPAVVVRAIIYCDSLDAKHIATQSYIFTNKVKTQPSYPGGQWPRDKVNDQALYFGVNSAVATDSRYANKIEEALKSIPSLSIVTDNAHLFDVSNGIYVNALSDGADWERPCAFELINPDGSAGFQVDAGLRIRGGWSRHGNFKKHSFRLFFRKEYNYGKLTYPLFGDEGVDEFDKIDLRTAQNYAWYRGSVNNTMLREVFSRDLQGEMNQPYTRSRYYHLYLNGLYYGLYQTQERSEARYAESYLGGDVDDYDVIKVDRDYDNGIVSIAVTDGNDDSWREIWDRMLSENVDDALYYNLIGCNDKGEQDPNVKCLVDVDNLIDYMIGVFYTGNFDSPISKFGKNEKPNNFYAIYDRTNPLRGYQFMQHDAEHTLFAEAHSPGIGLYEDRVNVHSLTNNYKHNVTSYSYFSPQWLHIRFLESKEYRTRFADRVYNYLMDGGILSEEANRARIKRRQDELSSAIIGESLRWGGTNASNKLTKDDHWIPEVNKIYNNFIPKRNAIFISQLEKSDIYPEVEAPQFMINDNKITASQYTFDKSIDLQMTVPAASSLLYTLNGKDPRSSGGGISLGVQSATSSISLSINATTQVIARAYKGGKWSAPRILYLNEPNANLEYLKITELHYHPVDSMNSTDTLSSSKYEFVELKNIHPTKSINLGGLKFTDGVDYEFPENFILEPQEFYVIASNAYKFYLRYGVLPSGDYQKHLSNGGENIRLEKGDGTLLWEFHYEDKEPWIEGADGTGYTMISYESNPISYTPDLTVYWWASADVGGSPFADDVASEMTALNIEKLKSTNDYALTVFPNPAQTGIQVYVQGVNASEQLNLTFYTLNGQEIYSTSTLNNTMLSLPASSILSGVYLLQVSFGEHSLMQRLIIQP